MASKEGAFRAGAALFCHVVTARGLLTCGAQAAHVGAWRAPWQRMRERCWHSWTPRAASSPAAVGCPLVPCRPSKPPCFTKSRPRVVTLQRPCTPFWRAARSARPANWCRRLARASTRPWRASTRALWWKAMALRLRLRWCALRRSTRLPVRVASPKNAASDASMRRAGGSLRPYRRLHGLACGFSRRGRQVLDAVHASLAGKGGPATQRVWRARGAAARGRRACAWHECLQRVCDCGGGGCAACWRWR